MTRRSLFLFLAALFSLATLTRADGLIVISNPPFANPGHFSFAPLEVTYHHVTCQINDQHAVTSVDQEFHNPNNARLEGDYIFPIPEGATIDHFSIDIDGKPQEAELLDAAKARQIYEDIVRKQKDPGLLEYAGRSVFRVHIFPIEPNSNKKIQLKYNELLKQDNGLLDYHYTLNTEKFSAAPLKNVSIKVDITSTQPLTSIYSPTHTVDVSRHSATTAVAAYEANDTRPDTDFHLYIGRQKSAVGLSVLTYRPDKDKDGYYLLLAAPSLKPAATVIPKDVVFVIDTSGSMAGAKIEQAKKALSYCVNSLNSVDHFDIVRFSTEQEPLFGVTTEADADNRKKALTFIDGMRAAGGTAIDDALKAAIKERASATANVTDRVSDGPALAPRMFMIVFLTDGEPTVGETNPDTILTHFRDASAGITRLFCFGLGNDVNTRLLDLLADAGRGASQYVLPNEDVEVVVSNFFSKVQQPALANVSLDFGGLHVVQQYPKNLPDLFAGDQLVAFGTYTGSGTTAATLRGFAGPDAQKFTEDVTFPEQTGDSNEWIAKLWATRRIGYLLDQIRLHGDSTELKDEITQLARRWGIVTPYTAMLIVEDEQKRNVAANDRTLRDLAKDRRAIGYANDNFASVSNQLRLGAQAVSNSANSSAYQNAGSLDAVAAAAKQSDSHLQAQGSVGAWDVESLPQRSNSSSSWGEGATSTAAPVDAAAGNGYRVITNYSQQNRQIRGRTFYLNGNQWQDAEMQNSAMAKHTAIVFGSDDYFAFLTQHPDSAAFLSLGHNVSLVIDGVVYDIADAGK